MADKLTHIDADGRARMVDVSDKASTKRVAKAEGRVLMSGVALELARSKGGKGDVRATAEIAGVMAAKKTSSQCAIHWRSRASRCGWMNCRMERESGWWRRS